MELTRRDAVAALAALGAGGTLSGCVAPPGSAPGNGGDPAVDIDTERIQETMVAAAEVVYPSAVSGTAEFVDTFLEGRFEDRSHAVALDETVAELNDLAESWYDGPFPTLAPDDRDRFLREVGADTAAENPDGNTRERIRYYVVNDLLLALYTSPTGGELVGLENPQGHPGGLESYQRGPDV